MTLRKTAGLLVAFGLLVGLMQSGVAAQFADQVTASQSISVGTFSCGITSATPGAVLGNVDGLGYAHSVTYTSSPIMSSAPGSAPFFFVVKNTGSIPDVLTVSTSIVSSPFGIIGAPFAPQHLNGGASFTYNTGVQWGELTNANLGQSGTVTWNVNCGEDAAAAGNVIFDNSPATVPSNLPSYGPEAYYFNEWGAGVTFPVSGPRKLATATVTMSSWACQSGSWDAGNCATTPGATFTAPMTFNVYNVGAGNTVGTKIATQTQTFVLPYRPSADPGHCPADPNNYAPNAVKWFDGATCYNGKAANITFTFSGETLPDSVIFGISYNTSTNGYAPVGAGNGGPLDSLNVATYPGTGVGTPAVAPSVGTWLPDGLSVYAANSVAGGGSGLFTGPTTSVSSQMNGFGGYMPAVQITAN